MTDQDWADQIAEAIVDAFLADETPDNLKHLRQAIVVALELVARPHPPL